MAQKHIFPRWLPAIALLVLVVMLTRGEWFFRCSSLSAEQQSGAELQSAKQTAPHPSIRSEASAGNDQIRPQRLWGDAFLSPATWHSNGVRLLAWLLGPLSTVAVAAALLWQRRGIAHYRSLYQAEAAKNNSEELYRIMLTSLGEGVIAADSGGRVQLLNSMAEKLTGWDQNAAQGRPLHQVFRVVAGDTGLAVHDPGERMRPEQLIQNIGNCSVLINREGGELPISGCGAPIHDTCGNPIGVVLSFRDQTQQRDAHQAMKRAQARFTALFRAAPIPMAVSRIPEGTLLDINDAACALAGRNRTDLLDAPVADLQLFAHATTESENVQHPATPGKILTQGIPCNRPDDTLQAGRLSAQTLDIEGERLCLFTVLGTMERAQAERAPQRKSKVDAALADLSMQLLEPDVTIEQLASRVLHHARRLTGSEHGFVASIDPVTGDQIVHSAEMKWPSKALAERDIGIVLPIGADGRYPSIWGRALNTREAFFAEDPPRHPAAQELPDGDVGWRSYLGTPIIAEGSLLGQIALANASGGYSSEYLHAVERLAMPFGLFLQQRRMKDELRESEARLRHVMGCLSNLAYSCATVGGSPRIDWLTGAAERITGYTAEAIKAFGCWRHLVHEADVGVFDRRVLTLLPGESGSCELRLRRRDGSLARVASFAECVADVRDPEARRIYGVMVDITRKHEDERKLRLNAAVMGSTLDGVMITDLTPAIVAVNPAYTEITGYSATEVLGRNPRILQSGRHGPEFYQTLWRSLLETGHWQGEIWNRRKNGEVSPEWVTISTVRNSEGEATHYVAVYTDIRQLKQSESRLTRLAHHDPLTELPNRLLVISRLEHAMERARRRQGRVAVLFLDLDHFKTVNDSLGHPAGDALLEGVARRLVQRLRKEDTLGRLGGDEFLVIVEDLRSADGATTVAQALLEALDKPFTLPNGQEIYIRASIGISLYPEDGGTSAELIRNADAAMYQVKDSGRNAYAYYTKALTQAATERLQMETRLRRALEREEFVLYYQPIVAVADNRLLGAEALVRWQPPGEDLMMPHQFLHAAEETGLIVPLGEWVLRHTCRQAKSWLSAGQSFGAMALNLSVRQFQQRNLERVVRSALDETGLPPTCLELEVTERCLMEQGERGERSIRAIKSLGVQLSIDDFGTGYSSLAYLKRLPLDRLKIDKSFIRDIPNDPNDTAISGTVIAMAHALGLCAIAEGVETLPQLEFLKQQGCDAYQGFLFCPPLPAEEFAARYLKNRD